MTSAWRRHVTTCAITRIRRNPLHERLTMPFSGYALLVLAAVAAMGHAGWSAETASANKAVETGFEQQVQPLLKTYCYRCHNEEKHKGDVVLTRFRTGASALAGKAELKDALIKSLNREMPPEKEAQPSESELNQFSKWLSSVKRLSPVEPGPGALRRLSRDEYANSLHDLFGIDAAKVVDLPPDGIGPGFSNAIAPLQLEKFLLIADDVLDQVIRPGQLHVMWKSGQWDALAEGKTIAGKADGGDCALMGTAQIFTSIHLPVDGTYTIAIRAGSDHVGDEPTQLNVRIGNQIGGVIKVLAKAKLPMVYTIRTRINAGNTALALFIANPTATPEPLSSKPAVSSPQAPKAVSPPAKNPPTAAVRQAAIDTIEITGPPAAEPTAVQASLFNALPGKDVPKREAARRIAEAFTRRAYRRPATSSEIEFLLRIFDLADQQDEVFTESVKFMLKSVLVSPQFLYLAAETKPYSEGQDTPIGDHQLAAKLSYMLWATFPDDELSALADKGTLHTPGILTQQVQRLIADPRSRAFFDSFGAQWLGLDRVMTMEIDEMRFPEFTRDLRRAMYEEAALFFSAILRENRSLLDLIDADFTFMNASLAKIYGQADAVKGPQLQRVTVNDINRGGILTMPGILAVNSLPNRTSPVKRGKWVLEQILGRFTPPPPANVPPLENKGEAHGGMLSIRQRYERHREDPACAGCHRTLDPIGFGLENFDVIGRWRNLDDAGQPVDPNGELPGRVAFHSPHDLKGIITMHKDEFCRTLVAKILAHALCRAPTDSDDIVAEDIAAVVAKDGYRLQTVLVQVALSYPFLHSH